MATRSGAREGVLVLVAVAFHLPSLTGPFVDDDWPYVANDEAVHSIRGALALFTEYPADGLYRPLTGLAYAAGHALWGQATVGYHVVNLVLWALTALAADRFLSRAVGRSSAFAATLLYVAHPAHCEVVDHITGLADVLAALLVFVSLLTETRVLVSLAVFFFALLAKESAAVVPLLLLVGTMTLEPTWPLWRRLRSLVPYAMVLALWAALNSHAVGSLRPRTVMLDHPTLTEWAATVGAVALGYLRILFFPAQLAVDRAYRIGVGVHHRFDVDAAVGFACVVLAALAFAVGARRARSSGRPAPFVHGLGFSLAAMAPYAHVVPFGALMAERFLHVALLGFAAALVAFVGPRVSPRIGGLLVASTVLGWGLRSAVRAADWRDPVSLWAPIAERFPDDPFAHLALGEIHLRAGRVADALVELERGVALEPHNGAGRNLLGMALLKVGDLAGAQDQFERALEEEDGRADAMNGLGTVAAREGTLLTARTWFTNALAIEPGHAQAAENLRDTDAAIERARKVRESQRDTVTDSNLLRQACVALEDAACVARADAAAGSAN